MEFKNMFKKKIELFSPVNGKVVSLKEVPDKVFAYQMMGPGIAFKFTESTIFSPCEGKVTLIPSTLHAIGITAKNGAEVLIHIGVDTVNLNGKGFEKLVNQGDVVNIGDPIIRINQEVITNMGYNLITPMVITNSKSYHISINVKENVRVGDSVGVIIKG